MNWIWSSVLIHPQLFLLATKGKTCDPAHPKKGCHWRIFVWQNLHWAQFLSQTGLLGSWVRDSRHQQWILQYTYTWYYLALVGSANLLALLQDFACEESLGFGIGWRSKLSGWATCVISCFIHVFLFPQSNLYISEAIFMDKSQGTWESSHVNTSWTQNHEAMWMQDETVTPIHQN